MDQHRVPDVSSGYHSRGDEIGWISAQYGGLPRLFAVRADTAGPPAAGPVAAWGVDFPDGTAITYRPGGAFGTWESPINAAAMLGNGDAPIYLTGPMPEPKPRDYTTGELTSAANLFEEAAGLLSPTADELMRIADGLEPQHADDALHFTRTARHLAAAALYLKVGEVTVRRLTRDVGRTYDALRGRLLGIIMAFSAGTALLGLASLLPGHLPYVLGESARGPAAYLLGFATATWIVHRGTRPPRDR